MSERLRSLCGFNAGVCLSTCPLDVLVFAAVPRQSFSDRAEKMSCLLSEGSRRAHPPSSASERVRRRRGEKFSDSQCLELKNMFVIPTFQVFERLVAPELPAVDVVSKSLSWLELLLSDQMLMSVIRIDFPSPAGGEE